MGIAEVLVTAGGALSIALLAWFFFGPKRAGEAELRGGVQEVEVRVKGGYAPDAIRVREGVPLRLVFDRQESGECTERVVFSDFRVSKRLPAFQRTVVELFPERAGRFAFACGMNMVHGELLVEANTGVAESPAGESIEAAVAEAGSD
jgi:Cu+-exporting ATPase